MNTFKQFISELYNVKLADTRDKEGNGEVGADVSDSARGSEKTKKVPLSQITSRFEGDTKNEPGTESREHIDTIAKHMRRGGSVPPILVRRHPKTGGYQVIDGHHRYFAHKQNGLKHIDVHVIPPFRAKEN
jgi:hypothetical protein